MRSLHAFVMLAMCFPGTLLWAMIITRTYRWCMMPQWDLPDVRQEQVLGSLVFFQLIHMYVWSSWADPKKQQELTVEERYTRAITKLFVMPVMLLGIAWIYSWLFL